MMAIQPMEFVDGLVQVESIHTREQAQACVDFLRVESQRHKQAMDWAIKAAAYHSALARFHQSAVDRHVPDIESTEKKIQAIAILWGLPGETSATPDDDFFLHGPQFSFKVIPCDKKPSANAYQMGSLLGEKVWVDLDEAHAAYDKARERGAVSATFNPEQVTWTGAE